MPGKYLQCFCCKKIIYRNSGRISEAKKFGWKIYCSLACLGLSRRNRKTYVCSRKGCNRKFVRTKSDLKKSKQFFCSCHCAARVNNKLYPKHLGIRKNCLHCGDVFVGNKKFCSTRCKFKGQTKPAGQLLDSIRDFYRKSGRIPLKRENNHCHAIRGRFGTWNNAIKAAGFDPNPVMFANKHIAIDGHKCDSLAEKIIDDWLYARKIKHQRSVPYPGNEKFTCDFVIGNKWIEFFGLHGEHKRYDLLRRIKLKMVKKYEIDLIEVFPNDVFPKKRLEIKFADLMV